MGIVIIRKIKDKNILFSKIKYILLILIISTLSSWGKDVVQCPYETLVALEKAGSNKKELEKAIEYFQNSGDRKKIEAICFLIANMPGHEYIRFALKNSSGTIVPFNPLAYPDYPSMVKAWDETENSYGKMEWKVEERISDISTITAEALIKNVELSFKAIEERPWSEGISFSDFLEYILPYRGTNEPIEDWRSYFMEKYKDLPSKMKNPKDPVEAAALINEDIKKWFKFDARFYRHPQDQGLKEMLDNKAGRCEDMANLGIYALRANGIAVAGDYTPFWADTGNNHAWNALILSDGRSIPFMAALENPGVYKLSNKAAKVYRGTFSKQKSNPAYFTDDKKTLPRWFKDSDFVDVTSKYFPGGDIEIEISSKPEGASSIPYMAVFNSGEWEIIGWGSFSKGKAVFKDYAKGILYLPVYYSSSSTIIPAGNPFIYTSSGDINILSADGPMEDISLISTTRRTIENTTDNIARSYLTSGKTYELYYWKGGNWVLVGSEVSDGKPLVFHKIPGNALLWLKEKDSKGEERVFTYDNGTQVWW